MRTAVLVLLVSTFHSISAQWMSDQDAKDQMRYDVQYLASDLLQGRETGTEGERLAAKYISDKFSSLGLMPKGDSATYLQHFPFQAPPIFGTSNGLQLGRKKLKFEEDFIPLSYSSSGQLFTKLKKVQYGIIAPDLGYDDYDGNDVTDHAAVISISSPDGVHPHSKYIDYNDLQLRVRTAQERGAVAVIFYNDDPTAEDPSLELSAWVKPSGIPVVFLVGDHEELLLDNNPCVISVDITREEKIAMNVVGLLDNGQKNVVVIGAHYDHLGMGGEGSLHRGEPAIHNGADDNASGVAAILQLAADLKEMDEARANDYLFIAFSGEEKGLYGSGYFTKNSTVPLSEMNYMINLDMVGRLDTSETIGINGVGTSPAWKEIDANLVGKLKVRTTQAGIGPSDHSSFYLKDIPAIHYFSGTHGDYHKPSDDEEKINYDGMLRIVRNIEGLVTSLNDNGKLEFTRTDSANTTEAPRFTVTLGVIPDYLYGDKGMRIDGITEGRPASNAGLKVGDVVVQMGDHEVLDMMSYMKALSKFKKGDATTVVVKRGKERVTAGVQF